MVRHTFTGLLLSLLSAFSCTTQKPAVNLVAPEGQGRAATRREDLFGQLLREDESLRPFLDKKDELNIQVIYTRIDRDRQNRPRFRDHYFNVDPARYFYPASTVKMPLALLSLEKLKKMNVPGVNSNTTMVTTAATPSEATVYNDPATPDGRPTLASHVRKVFLVSDNEAANRLYEFLGQKYLNTTLRAKGYPEAEILHRLNIFLPEEENRKTNPVAFLGADGSRLWEQPLQQNTDPYFSRTDSVGKGYYKGGKLISEPMDFSRKNRISLVSLHNILRSVMFPASVRPEQRFDISGEDLRMVRKAMGQYPVESDFPPYPSPEFYPAYCKFLLYGADRREPLLPSVRIFNKVGDAYGFLLDVAYVADFERGIEFMLSAVIYCNGDGILNDDTYDYETIGFPFMKYLGRAVYRYELTRHRDHAPDLSEFRLDW